MSDPYSAKSSTNATPQEKLDLFHSIIKPVKTSMLVSRNTDNFLHSRAMTPVSVDHLTLYYIANVKSGKTKEFENDSHVNISYYDPASTNWASLAGTATVTQDQKVIESVWNPGLKAWFGDLGDGKHTGDKDDPRIMVIVVKPVSIHFWHNTSSKLGFTYEVVKGAVTGDVASPGELMTIENDEIELINGLKK
ncbi:hypothetical protein E3P81_02540 [Wallemia ichthyophaga]|nr:hypothetical protein E3P97_02611 [Wallemia ichthyophaga]TIB31404.1 hypothetical protein E3P85_02264 [Wallemia ichthyophaga]TIB45870.1 hypothetical protein E3P82_02583 [Wallemia ichthyophaga]TIB49403.1 hypothetical protein E3P81_02540 [Wallemia ichthyophaga]TIB52498.1 hypothetical protein E3P80_02541 [Wallemia ichthyophaga]